MRDAVSPTRIWGWGEGGEGQGEGEGGEGGVRAACRAAASGSDDLPMGMALSADEGGGVINTHRREGGRGRGGGHEYGQRVEVQAGQKSVMPRHLQPVPTTTPLPRRAPPPGPFMTPAPRATHHRVSLPDDPGVHHPESAEQQGDVGRPEGQLLDLGALQEGVGGRGQEQWLERRGLEQGLGQGLEHGLEGEGKGRASGRVRVRVSSERLSQGGRSNQVGEGV